MLSGPLNRLKAILSLLHPLERYRTPSAIGSAIGRPYLALSRIQAQAGALNRLVLDHLGSSTARLWCYSVSNPLKPAWNKNAIGAAILNRVLDRDWNFQPQGATKSECVNGQNGPSCCGENPWMKSNSVKHLPVNGEKWMVATKIGRPQIWEQAHVGLGGKWRKRKGPCKKQCAWRKHGSCDTLLAEACPPKLWNCETL